jgi:NadR type nicotinamide-nucleotide adenylyltransferase
MIFSYQKPLSGKRVGVVFGSFAPLHQGHLDLIYRAKKENDGGAIVIVCGFDGDKGEPMMPHSRRYRYVREFFADDDLVAVYGINDTEIGAPMYPNGWPRWLEEFERIWKQAVTVGWTSQNFNGIELAVPKNPERVWYVGDHEYFLDLTQRNENAILVDRVADNPICATMIRQNPIKHWDKITFPFKRLFSHNILICGTASEGKSTLTADLGKYFNAPYSHEYARDYMKESCVADWELDGADFMAFLDGQYRLNRSLINSPGSNGIFFADSDSMVTRMYAEYYAKDGSCGLSEKEFEQVASMADAITAKCRWDKIFLLAPKGVFVDDHERYMAHSGMNERQELFNILCDNIKRSGNWDKVVILQEGYYENFMTIVRYVREVMAR